MFSLSTDRHDNVIKTVQKFLEAINVSVTGSTIIRALKEHHDYPSLLSIMDSLKGWKVKSLGLHVRIEELQQIPVPFIAHIRFHNRDNFTVVREIIETNITYFEPEAKTFVADTLSNFKDIYNGTVMLAEAEDRAGEVDYKQKRKKEQYTNARLPLALTLAVGLMVSLFIYAFHSTGVTVIFSAIFTLLSFAGMIVSGALLWYEVDQQNPTLQKICMTGKHTNCGAILHSKVARLGNLLSWSEVGFIYFSGGFLSLLLSGMSSSIMGVVSWLNILAVPYVLFSIYYQWRIARQWCVFCLTVVGLLVAELVVNIMAGLYVNPLDRFSLFSFTVLLFSFFAPILIWSFIKPLSLKSGDAGRYKLQLQRLKHDPRIFRALLPKQKSIPQESIRNLGITLGNPEAKYKLVKVCNPYCGPCANAHPVIAKILETNPEVSAQIIFTATDDEKDRRSFPARHLMAIAEKGDVNLTKQALDDWYNPPTLELRRTGASKKDSTHAKAPADRYEIFKERYPLNGELAQQGEKLKAMSEWCEKTGISFTPTFFVLFPSPPAAGEGQDVGYQLPDIYSVKDLEYLMM